MPQTFYQVDAFTIIPFAGNPAAVCVLRAPSNTEWMQLVAREMNLSETAFLLEQSDGFRLRWFTPAIEVDLCGHATLAAAHVLWEQKLLDEGSEARFHTRSGLLTARLLEGWIQMDFPAEPPAAADPPPTLFSALEIDAASYCGKNRFDYLLELDSETELRNLKPDFTQLLRVDTRGIIVTCRGSASRDYDFISRFFCPRVGVNEDPVTGSAHCCLGPYWQRRLRKETLVGFQASARGGIVRVQPTGPRVLLSGQAITTIHGQILLESLKR